MNTARVFKRGVVLELRTYSLKPSHFPAYMKLSQEKFHLRTAHSKLNGFWIHDLGGLNKVTHLWEYGSLEERAEVRAKLAGDASWISEYVTHLLPMLDNQVNSVVYQPKWASEIIKAGPKSGPYVMETLTLNKSAHLVEDEIKDLLKSRTLDLVNVLFTDIGPKNVVTIISQAENLSATQNQNFPENPILQSVESVVMMGAPWCPRTNVL